MAGGVSETELAPLLARTYWEVGIEADDGLESGRELQ